MGDHAPAGPGHRRQHRLGIERLQGRDVDHRRLDPLAGQEIGGLEGLPEQGTPAHERQVAALAHDEAAVERQGLAVVLERLLRRPVDPLGLEEDDGIRVADRREQQAVGGARRGRDDDADARDVGVERLGALGVVLGRFDAAAVGCAQHDRARQPAAGPVAQPPGMAHQLVDRGYMNPSNWNSTTGRKRCAPSPTARPAAGPRTPGVEHPGRAEAGEQAVGGAEHAAVPADILAQHQDARVLLHRPGEAMRIASTRLTSLMAAPRHERRALPGHRLGQLGEDVVDDVGGRRRRCREIGSTAASISAAHGPSSSALVHQPRSVRKLRIRRSARPSSARSPRRRRGSGGHRRRWCGRRGDRSAPRPARARSRGGHGPAPARARPARR